MSKKDSIASTIRSIREKLHITQDELANHLGVSFATVNRWERGNNEPQQAQLEAILALNSEIVANDELVKSEENSLEELFLKGQKQSEMAVDKKIKLTAQEILGSCSVIARCAEEQKKPSKREPTQISNNPLTNGHIDRNHQSILTGTSDEYSKTASEPALARVIVEREDGKIITYYFCRHYTPSGLPKYLPLVSLNHPALGRLASIPVGSDYDGPNDQSYTVLENARFFPKSEEREWDARKAEIRGGGYTKTVESLRALLRQDDLDTAVVDENLLESLINEESFSESIKDGIQRVTIERMALRERPILDQYQEEIFRLPLDSQLMLLGAPGTGKTTTLIRRLNLKTDQVFLDEDEKRLLARTNTEANYTSNWIMFTPTELLKLVVKEACNREGIPASDRQIRTWDKDFREDLARSTFPVLKSEANKGRFVMKNTVTTLTSIDGKSLIELSNDFDQWQKNEFWEELQVEARRLSENSASKVAGIGQKILSVVKDIDDRTASSAFSSLMSLTAEIKEIVEEQKKETDKKIQQALNIQVHKNRAFLDNLADFMKGLLEGAEDTEDDIDDDEEEIHTPHIGRKAAIARYMGVSRSYARARAQGKRVSKTSSTGRIIDWLSDGIISEDTAKEIGKSLIIQSALRRFMNPVRNYIDKTPLRYHRFRRAKQAEGHWYQAEGFAPTDAHPLEIDIILLAILRNTDKLIVGITNPDEDAKKTLDRLHDLYYTQVLVDEATDFSPIQLACMATLSHPYIRSFFACGDFDQRFTSYGVQSIEQVKWAIRDIIPGNRKLDKLEKRVSITYRHSEHLHRLAQALSSISGSPTPDVRVSEEYTENEGVAPVLAMDINSKDRLTEWLAARIKEIENLTRKLPSLAVLVNSEEDVYPVAQALERSLEQLNIRVTPCSNGQVRGRDGDIRVFNVQHIKGLEFEGVFFVGVDKLAEIYPDLFEKYLYVGATRAATYFGMTCEKDFPARISSIKDIFKNEREGWI